MSNSEVENLERDQTHSAFDTSHSEIKELPTAHSQLQTEQMEVHHHPEVEKKGLKEYILEGLMIFIAVMMGFFAESIREHITDRSKETEFMRTMVQDLKADTTELNGTVNEFNIISSVADSMLTSLRSGNPDPAVINHLVSNHFWNYGEYSYNNRTVQQLKNSGNFRLVQNTTVSGAILKYDNFQNSIIITQYNDLKNTMYTYKEVESKVIHYSDLKQDKGVSRAIRGFSPSDFSGDVRSPFITKNKELLALYYNRLFIHDALSHTFLRNIKYTKGEATKLITLIKKEYRLEDE